MNVTCDRCRTEYEFDDALVTSRGTVVRCMSCGFEFNVVQLGLTDSWTVFDAHGNERLFDSLAELQRAIIDGEVRDTDDLRRTPTEATRPLKDIDELAVFFAKAKKPRTARTSTAIGLAPVCAAKPVTVGDSEEQANEFPPASDAQSRAAHHGMDAAIRGDSRDPHGVSDARTNSEPALTSGDPVSEIHYDSELVQIAPIRDLRTADDGPVDTQRAPRTSRRTGGWVIAALVGMGAFAVFGLWFKKMQNASSSRELVQTVLSEAGRPESVADAEQKLAEQDLDAAERAFARLASEPAAILQTKQRGLIGLAQVANARADALGLRAHLQSSRTATVDGVLAAPLADLAALALTASASAVSAAPDDGRANVVRIDALRIHGDLRDARTLAQSSTDLVAHDGGAYALAMLDLTQSERVMESTVLGLHSAAALESVPGRARVALVYALALRNEWQTAKFELHRVTLSAKDRALAAAIASFIERAMTADSERDAAADTAFDLTPGGAGGGASESASGAANSEASLALSRGDVAHARAVYTRMLAVNPNDSEALAGLGDVEKRSGNRARARENYRRALAVNGTYLPARIAIADLAWEDGSAKEAASNYRDIVDQYPEFSYPNYVRERAADPPATGNAAAASTGIAATGKSGTEEPQHVPQTAPHESPAPEDSRLGVPSGIVQAPKAPAEAPSVEAPK